MYWQTVVAVVLLLLGGRLAAVDFDEEDDGDKEDVRERWRQEREKRAARRRELVKLRDNHLHWDLRRVVVTKVAVSGAPVGALLSDLRTQAREAGVKHFNIVYRCSPKVLKRQVDLDVQNVRMIDLIHMIAMLGDFSYEVTPYALVVDDKQQK